MLQFKIIKGNFYLIFDNIIHEVSITEFTDYFTLLLYYESDYKNFFLRTGSSYINMKNLIKNKY